LRVLITGGRGFAGSHLTDWAAQEGAEIFVLSLENESPATFTSPAARYFQVDIRDRESVRRLVREAAPDQIYHLAALSGIPESWADPRLTYEVNVAATWNLLEAAARLKRPPRILFVSSATVYQSPSSPDAPLDERAAIRPSNPYSTSKAMGELLCVQQVEAGLSDIVTVRPFNHIGPRQSPAFVCSSFARQIALMEMGLMPPVLQAGNLDVERDFTDVRDVVRAYWRVLQKGMRGDVYNVCSGRAYSLSWVLDIFRSLTSISFRVVVDQNRLRRQDTGRFCGNPGKMQLQTGWSPAIPIERSLADLLEYWRLCVPSQTPSGTSKP